MFFIEKCYERTKTHVNIKLNSKSWNHTKIFAIKREVIFLRSENCCDDRLCLLKEPHVYPIDLI